MERSYSGFRAPDRSQLSPLQAEHALREPFKRFISSTHEVVADVFSSRPIEFFNDARSIRDDFVKAGREYLQLHLDPIYYGYGLPRGHGEKAVVMGGLGSLRFHYVDTVIPLRRINYDAETYPWFWNVKSVKQRGKELLAYAREKSKESGGKIKAIGHSLGGYDWAAAFAENPHEFVEYVDHVVFDASPRPTKINKALESFYLLSRWPFSEDDLELSSKTELLKQAEEAGYIKITSIMSSHDPAVEGEMLGKTDDHFIIDNASHTFLGSNRHSLRIMAYRFANSDPEMNFGSVHREAIAA